MIDRSRWMGELSPVIRGRRLRELVIPGAHDAATAKITPSSEWSPGTSLLKKLSATIACDWSRAQGRTLYQLLNFGVRYLDLRIARSDSDWQLYFMHGLLGGHALEELHEVAAYLRDHQSEVVILDFQELNNMRPEDHRRFAEALTVIFAGMLIPPPAINTVLPSIGEIWDAGGQCVVLYSDDSGGQAALDVNKHLWKRKDYIESKWCETSDVNDLRLCLQAEVDKPFTPGRFFVLQAVLTPDLGSILGGALPLLNGLKSLREFADQYNGEISGWFLGPWSSKNLNILMMDWVEIGDVVGKAIELNRR